MLDLAIIEQQLDRQGDSRSAESTRLQAAVDMKHVELAPQEEALRTALALLADECS